MRVVPDRSFKIEAAPKWILLPLLLLMAVIWAVLAFAGIDFSVAFLAGEASVPIGMTAYMYRDAASEARYWCVVIAYCLVHAFALFVFGGKWIPKPAAALTPLFMLDYLALAYAFPKLSGLSFEDANDP